MALRIHGTGTARVIGRSAIGAALLVTALSTLPATAAASPPAPPTPAPAPSTALSSPESPTRQRVPPAPELPRTQPGRPAPSVPGVPAPAEPGQVRVPRGAPATGDGSADAGTDVLNAGAIGLGALGLASAAGAAGVAVTRRRRGATRA